jgi:hypothetical protein
MFLTDGRKDEAQTIALGGGNALDPEGPGRLIFEENLDRKMGLRVAGVHNAGRLMRDVFLFRSGSSIQECRPREWPTSDASAPAALL